MIPEGMSHSSGLCTALGLALAGAALVLHPNHTAYPRLLELPGDEVAIALEANTDYRRIRQTHFRALRERLRDSVREVMAPGSDVSKFMWVGDDILGQALQRFTVTGFMCRGSDEEFRKAQVKKVYKALGQVVPEFYGDHPGGNEKIAWWVARFIISNAFTAGWADPDYVKRHGESLLETLGNVAPHVAPSRIALKAYLDENAAYGQVLGQDVLALERQFKQASGVILTTLRYCAQKGIKPDMLVYRLEGAMSARRDLIDSLDARDIRPFETRVYDEDQTVLRRAIRCSQDPIAPDFDAVSAEMQHFLPESPPAAEKPVTGWKSFFLAKQSKAERHLASRHEFGFQMTGHIHRIRSEPLEAAEAFLSAAAVCPRDQDGKWEARAFCYYKAAESFRNALKLFPGSVDPARAIESYEEAAKVLTESYFPLMWNGIQQGIQEVHTLSAASQKR